MNDPHVQSLRYCLETKPGVVYQNPSKVDYETNLLKAVLENNILTVYPKAHYRSEGDAVLALAGDLRAWEISAGLELGPGYLQFTFDGAEVVDRDPSGAATHVGAAVGMVMAGKAECDHVKAAYPNPPSAFSVTPLVSSLWYRYDSHLSGNEPLASMGYFCLSSVQADAGGRGNTVAKYGIDRTVLDELGRLTSDVGDSSTARKIDQRSTHVPHTATETEWIKAAVRMLIRRAGEFPHGVNSTVPMIAMSDLPAK